MTSPSPAGSTPGPGEYQQRVIEFFDDALRNLT
jgi:hypothetical protein